MGGLSNFFRGVARLGHKVDRGVLKLGQRFSHTATRVLQKTQRIATVAENIPIPPVSLLGSAVKDAARVAEIGIEIGKDVDTKGVFSPNKTRGEGIQKAKARLPELQARAVQVPLKVEAAAMFI